MQFIQPFLDSFRLLGTRIAERAPGLVIAFVLLLLGLVAARWVRSFLESALQRAKLDEHTAKVGINEITTRLGLGKSPTYVIGFVVYWVILLMCFLAAADAVNLNVVKELIQLFLNFLPELLAAILILFGALIFARFLSEVVANAAAANDIRGGLLLSKATYGVVVVFAALTALDHLGIRVELVTTSIQIVLASAGFGLALAFGLGGRGLARDYLQNLIQHRKKD